MNNYKKLFIIFFLVIITIIGIPYLLLYQTPWARKVRQNVSNSLKIEIGMSKQEAIQIMGEPDDKRISSYISPCNKVDSMYYYEPPFGASDGIYIQFDSNTSKVNGIVLWGD